MIGTSDSKTYENHYDYEAGRDLLSKKADTHEGRETEGIKTFHSLTDEDAVKMDYDRQRTLSGPTPDRRIEPQDPSVDTFSQRWWGTRMNFDPGERSRTNIPGTPTWPYGDKRVEESSGQKLAGGEEWDNRKKPPAVRWLDPKLGTTPVLAPILPYNHILNEGLKPFKFGDKLSANETGKPGTEGPYPTHD